jgi:hypothetical protein
MFLLFCFYSALTLLDTAFLYLASIELHPGKDINGWLLKGQMLFCALLVLLGDGLLVRTVMFRSQPCDIQTLLHKALPLLYCLLRPAMVRCIPGISLHGDRW